MQQNYPGPGMGHPGGPPGGMMPFNRFQGRPMGPLAIPSQGFIAAPPRYCHILVVEMIVE